MYQEVLITGVTVRCFDALITCHVYFVFCVRLPIMEEQNLATINVNICSREGKLGAV